MTQEERRALFEKKAMVGKERNDMCNRVCADLIDRIDKKEILISDALCLAFAEGCDYGKARHKKLEIFDKNG